MSKKVKIKDLAPAVKKAVQKDIATFKKFDAESEAAKKNQHIINLTDTSSVWIAGGEFDVAAAYWYRLSADLLITNFSQFAGLRFYATGSGGIGGLFECEIAGAFYVNPASLIGDCHYTLAIGAGGEGAVALGLYSSSNTKWGLFGGDVEGVGAGYVSGTGSLSIINF